MSLVTPAAVPWADLATVLFVDMASTRPTAQNRDPDYTAGCWLGVTTGRTKQAARGIWYVLHVERCRETPAATEDMIWNLHEKVDALYAEHGVDLPVPIRIEQEGGSAGAHVADQMARGRFAGLDFAGRRPKGSKAERARPVAIAAEAGHIHLLAGTWVEDFLSELELFPESKMHDDQVDAFSGAFKELAPLVREGGVGPQVIPKADDGGSLGWGVLT